MSETKKIEVLIPFVPEWEEDGEKRGFFYREWHKNSVETLCQICHVRDVVEVPKAYAERCVRAGMARFMSDKATVTREPMHYRFEDELDVESGSEKSPVVFADAKPDEV